MLAELSRPTGWGLLLGGEDHVGQKAIDDLTQLDKEGVKQITEALAPGETIRVVIPAYVSGGVVATDWRVFVYKVDRGFTGRHNQLSTYEYRSISGVQMETGPITGKLFLQVPGESSTDVSKAPNGIKIANNHYARAREGVALLRQYVAEAHTATEAPAPAPDIADQLRKLGELRDAGVLTNEEFSAKKADLLARM